MDRCTTTSGVVVAVDFGHWSGPLVRGCGSTPTTGYQLVNQGGFGTTGTVHDGPGFVCRIHYSGFRGGTSYPTASEVGCGSTPPASAAWSYWNADPGQHGWTLSPTGAASTNPVAGAVQAWTFGSGYPTFSPDSVRAHTSSPAPSSRASTGQSAPTSKPVAPPSGTASAGISAASTGNRPATGRASSLSSRVASSSPPASSAAGRVSSAAASGSSAPSSSPTAGPTILDARPDAATRKNGSGSYLPELAGGAVLLGLAGLAGFTAWQRKRSG